MNAANHQAPLEYRPWLKMETITCRYINNHFEGSAPRSLERFWEALEKSP